MPDILTRRRFLARAACAGAMVGLVRPDMAADGMFVSLNGSLTPGVGGADKIRLAARLGYGGVDWDFGPARRDGVEATRALFAELGVKPTITGLPFPKPGVFAGDDATFREGLKALADDAPFVAAIGCDRLMLVLSPAGPRPRDEQRRLVVDRLSAVAEVLQPSRLRLGLEFLGPLYMRSGPGRGGEPRYPFIWTLPDTVALAADSGPNIGVVLDVWHWHHSNGTVADILATDPTRIVHLHLSDANPLPPEDVRDNQRLMPGEGIIDLTGFLQALSRIGYRDGVSPEPLGRIPKDMSPEDGARMGLETTLAVMRKAGVA
jgi:sugar phosphate isomerase/epimerase